MMLSMESDDYYDDYDVCVEEEEEEERECVWDRAVH